MCLLFVLLVFFAYFVDGNLYLWNKSLFLLRAERTSVVEFTLSELKLLLPVLLLLLSITSFV